MMCSLTKKSFNLMSMNYIIGVGNDIWSRDKINVDRENRGDICLKGKEITVSNLL